MIREMGLKLGPAVNFFARIERLQKYQPYVPETLPITPPASLTPETVNRTSTVTQKTPEATGRTSIVTQKESSEVRSCEPEPKRRPGRPRIHPLPDAGTKNGQNTSEESPSASEGTKRQLENALETPIKTESTPKRKCGRPKKYYNYSN